MALLEATRTAVRTSLGRLLPTLFRKARGERKGTSESTAEATRHAIVRGLFLRAIELPDSERGAFLHDQSEGDLSLVGEVERLLVADRRAAGASLLTVLSAASLDDEPVPDKIGSYRVLRRIGAGGMGAVYQGVGESGEAVAIKVPHLSLLSPGELGRFEREAAVLRRLEHPNISRFIAIGRVVIDGVERPYLVMEYIEGTSFREYLSAARPDTNEKARLLAEIADALHYAHVSGIVHRDLKPTNILIASGNGRPIPKVIDFGVARILGLDRPLDATLTTNRPNRLIGTIGYLSPEHFSPGEVTPRSDVYSLGVIAYEAFAGVLPYGVPSNSEWLATWAPLTSPVLPLPPQLATRDLDLILKKALAKSPAERYADASDFARDLQRASQGERPSVRPHRIVAAWRGARHLAKRRTATLSLLVALPLVWVGLLLVRQAAEARSTDRALQGLYREIEQVDLIRHSAECTEAQLLECILRLEQADQTLAALSPRPFYPHLHAYMLFRLGELHFFLGERLCDRTELVRARDMWMGAWNVPRDRETLRTLKGSPDTQRVLAGLSLVAPAANCGLASRLLGRMASPRTEYGVAFARYGWVRDALLAGRITHNFLWESTDDAVAARAHEREYERALADAFTNVGVSQTDLGCVCDSLGAIEDALESFGIADTSRALALAPETKAVELRSGARALLMRAELTGNLRDIEAARARLQAASHVPGADPPGRLFATTFLSESYRVEARIASDHRRRERALVDGLSAWEAARALPRSEERPSVVAAAYLEEAMLRTALVELVDPSPGRDASPAMRQLDLALTCADSASAWLRPDREPSVYAGLLRVRGRVERLRWQRTGDPNERNRALTDLRSSLDYLPPVESPHHERLVRAELSALEAHSAGGPAHD